VASTIQKMNERYSGANLALLIETIRAREGIDLLLERGLDVAQIADLLRAARLGGFIEQRESGETVPTDAGLRFLSDVAKSTPDESSGWVTRAERHRVPNIGAFDVFLPEAPPGRHD